MYEIIPGALSWGIIFIALLLSFVAPRAALIFIIIFDLFWFLRVVYFTAHLVVSWQRMKKTIRQGWYARLAGVPGWERITHLIFLPTYKEDISVLRQTLRAIVAARYPKDRLYLVLAGEERDRENFEVIAAALRREFETQVGLFLTTLHPAGRDDEIPGKGSNLHFAGQAVLPEIRARGVNVDDVIVSALDVDTALHPEYFAYLTYTWCTHPNPRRSSYQPIPLFGNTMWSVPAVVRIMAFGTTFWLMSELTRPQRLLTFSSHSMPLCMLIDVGFWDKRIVSEDSRIFIQGFLRYHGNYSVTPLFMPVSMDTVPGGVTLHGIKNLYTQQRRWAYGVENFPYMLWHFRRDRVIPWVKKARLVCNELEGKVSWATAALLILFLGRLPAWAARAEIKTFTFVQAAPFTLEFLMTAAMVGLIVAAALSFFMLPPRPAHVPFYSYISFAAQWALVPLALVVVGAFPALDAQTRLMRGRYLSFNVTAKRRAPTLARRTLPLSSGVRI